jgi:hypothetical protein
MSCAGAKRENLLLMFEHIGPICEEVEAKKTLLDIILMYLFNKLG